VVAPPERCPSVGPGELRRSAQAAVDWFARNQRPDGTWLYLYDARDDSAPSEYNLVRHAGAAMGLYQAAAAGLPQALRSADSGTGWALDGLVRQHGWAAFGLEDRIDTGATALLAAGLAIRRDSTGDRRYDALLRGFGRFLLAQTKPSGAVLASYDTVRGRPVPGEYSKYFTGETYWALALLDRAFPGEGWGAAADRVGAYLATSRDEAEHHSPPVQDHWAAYGLSETVKFPSRGRPPLTGDELAYARRQAELFSTQVRWISQRYGPWGALVRPGYMPRGGGYGVIDEALTGLWRTARREPRLADLREPIAARATCIAGLAVRAQSDREDASRYAQPDRVEGAWFRDGETRMDDQQHALDGLLRTIAIVRAGEGASPAGSAGSDNEAPAAWLWAAALVLALNPVRAGFGVPRSGRSPQGVAAVAAAGGAIGGLAVCAVAIAGDPLLEALDVSEPSFRVAAGIVAVLAGAADLLRRPPQPEPALSGRRAALIPVAIPLVARPALLLMALGAAVDRGVLVSAAAMALGIALLTALVAAWPATGPRARALRWSARLLGAALVACGAILTIDGVLDV
jgi:small neutral amino acid transporter SnatA (MarC family)